MISHLPVIEFLPRIAVEFVILQRFLLRYPTIQCLLPVGKVRIFPASQSCWGRWGKIFDVNAMNSLAFHVLKVAQKVKPKVRQEVAIALARTFRKIITEISSTSSHSSAHGPDSMSDAWILAASVTIWR